MIKQIILTEEEYGAIKEDSCKRERTLSNQLNHMCKISNDLRKHLTDNPISYKNIEDEKFKAFLCVLLNMPRNRIEENDSFKDNVVLLMKKYNEYFKKLKDNKGLE